MLRAGQIMHLPGTFKSNAVMHTFYDVDTINCYKHHVLHNLNFRVLPTIIHTHKLSKQFIHSLL